MKLSPTLSDLSSLFKALAKDKSLITRSYILYFLLHSLPSLTIPLPSLLKLGEYGREGFFSDYHSRAVIFLGFSSDIIKVTFGCGYGTPFARLIPVLENPLRRS